MRLSTPSCIQMWTPDKKNDKMQEYYLYPQYELSQQLHVACSDGPPQTMHTVVQRFATYKCVCVCFDKQHKWFYSNIVSWQTQYWPSF